MFGADPEVSGTGTIAFAILLVILGVALLKDHVVQDKIVSIYNRVFKKYPF